MKIINLYQEKVNKNLFNGAITSIFLQVLTVLSQLILTPLIILNTNLELLGAYAFLMQLIALLIILDFGVSASITRYLSRNWRNDNKQFYSYFALSKKLLSIIGVLCSITLLIINSTGVLNHALTDAQMINDLTVSLYMFSVWLVIKGYLNSYSTAINAMQEYATYNWSAIVELLVKIILSAYFIKNGYGLLGLVIAHIFGEVVSYSIRYYKFIELTKGLSNDYKKNKKDNKQKLKKIFNFAKKYWVTMLGTMLIYNTDQIVISQLFGAEESAKLYIVKTFVLFLIQIFVQLSDLLIPWLNQKNKHEANKKSNYYHNLSLAVTLLITVFLSLILFKYLELSLLFWVGQQDVSIYLMLLMMVMLSSQTIAKSNEVFILVTNEYGRTPLYTILLGIITIISALSLGPSLEVYQVFTFYAGAMFLKMTIVLSKSIGHHQLKCLNLLNMFILCVTLVSIFSIFPYLLTINSIGTLVFDAIVFTLCYAAITWVLLFPLNFISRSCNNET